MDHLSPHFYPYSQLNPFRPHYYQYPTYNNSTNSGFYPIPHSQTHPNFNDSSLKQISNPTPKMSTSLSSGSISSTFGCNTTLNNSTNIVNSASVTNINNQAPKARRMKHSQSSHGNIGMSFNNNTNNSFNNPTKQPWGNNYGSQSSIGSNGTYLTPTPTHQIKTLNSNLPQNIPNSNSFSSSLSLPPMQTLVPGQSYMPHHPHMTQPNLHHSNAPLHGSLPPPPHQFLQHQPPSLHHQLAPPHHTHIHPPSNISSQMQQQKNFYNPFMFGPPTSVPPPQLAPIAPLGHSHPVHHPHQMPFYSILPNSNPNNLSSSNNNTHKKNSAQNQPNKRIESNENNLIKPSSQQLNNFQQVPQHSHQQSTNQSNLVNLSAGNNSHLLQNITNNQNNEMPNTSNYLLMPAPTNNNSSGQQMNPSSLIQQPTSQQSSSSNSLISTPPSVYPIQSNPGLTKSHSYHSGVSSQAYDISTTSNSNQNNVYVDVYVSQPQMGQQNQANNSNNMQIGSNGNQLMHQTNSKNISSSNSSQNNLAHNSNMVGRANYSNSGNINMGMDNNNNNMNFNNSGFQR